jgi:hypothetical protein
MLLFFLMKFVVGCRSTVIISRQKALQLSTVAFNCLQKNNTYTTMHYVWYADDIFLLTAKHTKCEIELGDMFDDSRVVNDRYDIIAVPSLWLYQFYGTCPTFAVNITGRVVKKVKGGDRAITV